MPDEARADARRDRRRARSTRADWMWEPKLDGYRVLAFIDEQGREAALAARPRPDRARFRSSSPSSRKQAVDGHDPRRRDRRVRRQRQAVVRRAAGSRAAEDRARDRRGRPSTPVVFYCFDLLHFAGIDLREAPYARPPPLSRAVPAALAARAARARRGRRRRAARGGARERLRRRDRQAQGQPLRSRPALGGVAQGQADAERRVRRRRLHEGQGLARGARRAAARLLGQGSKLHYASHVGSGSTTRTLAQVQGSARAAAAQDLSVRREARD